MKPCTLIQMVFLVGILNFYADAAASGTCSLDQLSLVLGNGMNTVTPMATIPVVTTDGLLKTTISCDVSGIPDAVTYMNFQDGTGGPMDPMNYVSADLICDNGSWVFTHSGQSSVITEVACLYAGPNLPCGVCTPNAITFTSAMGLGTVDSYWRDYAIDHRGCASLTAVCPTSSEKEAFMEFNGYVGGVYGSGNSEVTATLNCVDGKWQFTDGDITTQITSINCLAV